MKKSKQQSRTGNILLAGGAIGFVAGIVTASVSYSSGGEGTYRAGLGLTAAGLLSMASSIPFYIASGSNKKKSLSVSPVMERVAVARYGSMMAYKSYPAIGIQLRLGNSR